MRAILLCFFCLWLTGCAYYGDMHANSQPLTAASLSTSHVYNKITMADHAHPHWWNQLRNSQLNALIDAALADSPTLAIAEARVKQAQYLAMTADSALWPSVDFNGYVQRQRFSEFGLVPPPFNGRTYNIGTLALNFNYEFDFWGKNRQALKEKLNSERAYEAELAEAQLVLSSAVANTYLQLCDSTEQIKLARANLQLSKQILQIAFLRTQRGIDSEIPVKMIEAKVQAAEQTLEKYQQAELLARHQLAVLLGKNPLVTHISIEKMVLHTASVQLPKQLPASLLAERPDIGAAKARAEAAANAINVAKAGFFPNINLSALYSYQAAGLGRLFESASQNNAITGAIDLPIFDAGRRRANLGAKYAEFDVAVNEYNKTILTALHEVADQLAILQTVHAQLSAQNSALAATQHNYKLYSLRYNHGIANYVSVLESKQRVVQQQAMQITLQTQQLQAVVLMLKALGGPSSISQG